MENAWSRRIHVDIENAEQPAVRQSFSHSILVMIVCVPQQAVDNQTPRRHSIVYKYKRVPSARSALRKHYSWRFTLDGLTIVIELSRLFQSCPTQPYEGQRSQAGRVDLQ